MWQFPLIVLAQALIRAIAKTVKANGANPRVVDSVLHTSDHDQAQENAVTRGSRQCCIVVLVIVIVGIVLIVLSAICNSQY